MCQSGTYIGRQTGWNLKPPLNRSIGSTTERVAVFFFLMFMMYGCLDLHDFPHKLQVIAHLMWGMVLFSMLSLEILGIRSNSMQEGFEKKKKENPRKNKIASIEICKIFLDMEICYVFIFYWN